MIEVYVYADYTAGVFEVSLDPKAFTSVTGENASYPWYSYDGDQLKAAVLETVLFDGSTFNNNIIDQHALEDHRTVFLVMLLVSHNVIGDLMTRSTWAARRSPAELTPVAAFTYPDLAALYASRLARIYPVSNAAGDYIYENVPERLALVVETAHMRVSPL